MPRPIRMDQITVKMSRESHDWLVEHKKATGASVRFTIDRAISMLRERINRGHK